MRRLKMVLGVLTVLYGVLAALTYGFQRRAVFPAPRDVRKPAIEGAVLLEIPGPLASKASKASKASMVYALHAPAKAGAPTVVHFHGNGEQLADTGHLARQLTSLGLGVYVVEYPGYGLAAGTASEFTIYEAADAALSHLRGALGVPNEKIVLQGQSLGSGVATEMAARGYGGRLVLISPYTSMSEMLGRFVPFLPSRALCRDPFDTAAKAERIDLPVLIIHGSADTLIPLEMGRRLAKIFPRARLEIIEGAGHNDLFSGMFPALLPALAAFAKEERDAQ